jgi:hypothetical protein
MRMGLIASFLTLSERRALLELAEQQLFDLFSDDDVVEHLRYLVNCQGRIATAGHAWEPGSANIWAMIGRPWKTADSFDWRGHLRELWVWILLGFGVFGSISLQNRNPGFTVRIRWRPPCASDLLGEVLGFGLD